MPMHILNPNTNLEEVVEDIFLAEKLLPSLMILDDRSQVSSISELHIDQYLLLGLLGS